MLKSRTVFGGAWLSVGGWVQGIESLRKCCNWFATGKEWVSNNGLPLSHLHTDQG
jgi:hypothetical protein